MIGAAILGAGLLGAGSSIYASKKQSDSAKNALAAQQSIYNQNQANAKPYITAGTDALDRLNASYDDPYSFSDTPDYKFGRSEGLGAIQNSAAARGGMLGGNFLRRADQYGTDYAYNYLDRYRAGNQATANMGSNATAAAASSANTSAGLIGRSYNYLGGAEASGAVGASNALTGGVQNYLTLNSLGQSSYGNNSGGYGAWPAGPTNAPSWPNPYGGSWYLNG